VDHSIKIAHCELYLNMALRENLLKCVQNHPMLLLLFTHMSYLCQQGHTNQ